MKIPMGLVYGTLGLVIFLLIFNVALSIYEPQAVSNVVKATTNQTFTVDGASYTVAGNGQTAQAAVQAEHDNINTLRTTGNVLLGIALLILVIVGVVDLIKGKHD